MTLLDRLLPKNWQTQVASTFGPKRFPKLSQSEFTPGLGGSEPYDKYTDFLNQGLQLTEEGYDFYTGQKKAGTDWDEVWESLIGGYGGEDPTESFSKYWVDPSKVDPINVFDPDSLISGFQRAGLHDANKSMFTPFQASDLRALDPSFYTAQMEKDRSNLATSLQNKLASSAGLGGGFAGYGGRTEAQDLATQQFQSGAEGLYADINKQRAGAVGGLYSKLEDYDKLISKAT